MKTQTMKSPRLHPRKTNDRWKWMATAAAAATAAAPHAPGATAQISLVNNQLDAHSSPANQLSFDISVGGNPFCSYYFYRANVFNNTHVLLHARLAGVSHTIAANHLYYSAKNRISFAKGEIATVVSTGASAINHYALIPISLTDPNIQAGTTVDGLLEVEASVNNTPDGTISLLDVFYPMSGTSVADLSINASTGAVMGDMIDLVGSSDDGVYTADIPEPSGLALLAMGAAGVLAYRRRRKAA